MPKSILFFSLFLLYVNASAQFTDNTPVLGSVRPSGLVHILDIALRGNIAYSGGSGGLWIVDVANLNAPRILGTVSQGGRTSGQLYGLELNGNFLYGFSRTRGMAIYDVSSPTSPRNVGSYLHRNTDSYERGVLVDTYLYIAAHHEGIEVADANSPTAPRHVTTVSTGNAFAVVASGDYLFVANGSHGFAVLNISNRTAPVLVATRATTALAQDVTVEGDYAYVAVGSAGMDVFDIRDPVAPTSVSNYHVDGFTNRLAVENGVAYLANWETVEVVDVSSPATPRLVATEHARLRAMSVAVRDSVFFVGDWAEFRICRYEDVAAPDVNADPLEMAFGTVSVGNSQSLMLNVENLGQEPLTVTGLETVGSGFSTETAAFTLSPFESREFAVTYTPVSTQRASGFVNVRSNDPDEPQKIIPVSGGNRTIGVGDTPTDFTLFNTAGQSFNLQEQINQGLIVVMAFYASW